MSVSVGWSVSWRWDHGCRTRRGRVSVPVGCRRGSLDRPALAPRAADRQRLATAGSSGWDADLLLVALGAYAGGRVGARVRARVRVRARARAGTGARVRGGIRGRTELVALVQNRRVDEAALAHGLVKAVQGAGLPAL